MKSSPKPPLFSSGGDLQGPRIPDADVAAIQLQCPGLPELGEGPGHGHALGADHGGQLLVGVAGGDLVAALAGDDPFALDEPEDQARQTSGYFLEPDVRYPTAVQVQALAEQLYDLQAHRGPVVHQTPEAIEAHEADPRRLQSLRIRPLGPGRERHLPEHRTDLDHVQGEFLPSYHLVQAYPPLEEQEDDLGGVSRRVEGLAPLQVEIRDPLPEPTGLLDRQRLQYVHQGEKLRFFLRLHTRASQ